MLGFSLFLRSWAGPGPALTFSGSGGDRGLQVGGVAVVAAGPAGRGGDQVVAGRVQDGGEGDLVGVDAQIDRGGHGVVDEGVVDRQQGPDFLFCQVRGLAAEPAVAAA